MAEDCSTFGCDAVWTGKQLQALRKNEAAWARQLFSGGSFRNVILRKAYRYLAAAGSNYGDHGIYTVLYSRECSWPSQRGLSTLTLPTTVEEKHAYPVKKWVSLYDVIPTGHHSFGVSFIASLKSYLCTATEIKHYKNNCITHTHKTRRHFSLTYFKWNTSVTYLLTYLLTHSMEQSPSWEANWFCS